MKLPKNSDLKLFKATTVFTTYFLAPPNAPKKKKKKFVEGAVIHEAQLKLFPDIILSTDIVDVEKEWQNCHPYEYGKDFNEDVFDDELTVEEYAALNEHMGKQ